MISAHQAMGVFVGAAVDEARQLDSATMCFGERTAAEVRAAHALIDGGDVDDHTRAPLSAALATAVATDGTSVQALFPGGVPSIQHLPSFDVTHLHGEVDGRAYRALDLMYLAEWLIGNAPAMHEDFQAAKPVGEIRPGVYASNAMGALTTPKDWAVLSLCRVWDHFLDRPWRREFVLVDAIDANDDLAAVADDAVREIERFRAEGRPIVVHCWAGESRTAFALRAWLQHSEGLTADESADALRAVWPFMHQRNTDFEAELRRRG